MCKVSQYQIYINFNCLILVLPNNSSHFTLNRVKCEKQILPSVGFEPTSPRPSPFAASILPLNHKGFTVVEKHQG